MKGTPMRFIIAIAALAVALAGCGGTTGTDVSVTSKATRTHDTRSPGVPKAQGKGLPCGKHTVAL